MRLQPGEILVISSASMELAARDAKRKNMLLGLAVQYEHDAELGRRGVQFTPGPPKATYDRIVNGIIEDDKVATWTSVDESIPKKLSATHSITSGEFDHWQNVLRAGGDVLIHSFEFLDERHLEALYLGAISFRMLYNAPGPHSDVAGQLKPWSSGSYSFPRESAIQHNSVKM